MNSSYKKHIAAMIAAIAITGSACGQHSKVKTITIVNGDTTISESETDGKALSELEKEMNISISGAGNQKTVTKKVIITGDDEKTTEARAYAYSFGDDAERDIEVITNGDESDTKIIIKKEKKEPGEKEEATERKTIVKKEVRKDGDSSETTTLNMNISVKNTTAKVEVQSNSKAPINISILDENGKQVFYDSPKSGGNYSREVPLGKKGTYFLSLIQDKKVSTEKIVVH